MSDLERALTEKWEAQLEVAQTMIIESTYHLGRLAAIYSTQLSFEDEQRDKYGA